MRKDVKTSKTVRKASKTVRITKTLIENAWRQRKPDSRLTMRDTECRGLTLVVNQQTMTWSYAYRPRGKDPNTAKRWPSKELTLGNPASLSIEDARIAANQLKGQVAAGSDPVVEKKQRAAAEQLRRSTTLERLAEIYATVLPKRPKLRGTGLPSPDYIGEELAQVRMSLADMDAADKPAADLTSTDIRQLLSGAGGITTARHRFSALSRFLDWCHDAGHIQVNPCVQIDRNRRPRTPQARAHYLSLPELAHLWHAAERLRQPVWRDLVRFLICCPCRRGEATEMDWAHLDLEAAEWRQPGKLTKNRDPHRLHLHPLALSILRARHEAAGKPRTGLVFAAPRSSKAIDTFTKIKGELVAAASMNGWTWHDFRRSFATALGEAGISETIADAMLNHRQSATRGGVLGVYQRAARWPEQQRAMALWGQLLADAIDGRAEDGNVVTMALTA